MGTLVLGFVFLGDYTVCFSAVEVKTWPCHFDCQDAFCTGKFWVKIPNYRHLLLCGLQLLSILKLKKILSSPTPSHTVISQLLLWVRLVQANSSRTHVGGQLLICTLPFCCDPETVWKHGWNVWQLDLAEPRPATDFSLYFFFFIQLPEKKKKTILR